MKLVIDMNLSPRLVPLLSDAGHQTVFWETIGKPNAEDAEILTWARENGYVVLTNDLDFGTILAATGLGSPSVVQIRRRNVRAKIIAPHIIRAIEEYAAELKTGALLVVDEYRYRVRLLPLA
jgi:predicted nuclease of predicted toxin-antitoxin system